MKIALSAATRLAFSQDESTGDDVVIEATSSELETVLALTGQPDLCVHTRGCGWGRAVAHANASVCTRACGGGRRDVAHYAVLLVYAFARSSKVRAALCKLGAVDILVGWCAKQLLAVIGPGRRAGDARCVGDGGGAAVG